jgi:cellulose synthase/poly-beta-1,6-N-acetylglucosamine synthase-like glycosyltransferase
LGKDGLGMSQQVDSHEYPKISFLIPAYKEEAVIGDALKQLTEEVDYPSFEIIVGIDGDYDNTYQIAEAFADKYDNILIDYDPVRRGVTERVRRMLAIATGHICVKFDADMRLGNPKTALYNMARYFEDSEVGAIYYCGEYDFERTAYEYMEPRYIPELEREREKSIASRAENFMSILAYQYKKRFFPITKDSPVPVDTHCFRRELITHLDGKLVHDDVALARNIVEKGYRIDLAPDVIVFTPGGQPYDTKALWDQKIKSSVGWIQMERRYGIRFKQYCLGIVMVFLRNFHRARLKDIVAFFYWIIVFSFSYIVAYFRKNRHAKDVWKRWERRLG